MWSILLYISPMTLDHLFKPLPKRSIFYGVMIFFGKWLIYKEIAISQNIDPYSNVWRVGGRRINNRFRDRRAITISLWMAKRFCPRRELKKGFSVIGGFGNRRILSDRIISKFDNNPTIWFYYNLNYISLFYLCKSLRIWNFKLI